MGVETAVKADVPRYRWWALLVGALTQAIVTGAAWTIMPVLFQEIAQPLPAGLNLDLIKLGSIWAMLPLAAALCCIPMGMWADRYGVRWVVGLAIVLAGIAGTLRGMSGGYIALLVWMFLFGIGYSSIGANLPKLVGMWFPSSELGLANGIVMGCYGLGAGLAITFGGSVWSPAVGGWRNILYILGVASLLIGITWCATIKDRKPEGLPAAAEGSTQPSVFHSIAVALKTWDVWLLAIVMFTYQGGYVGAIGYLPMYLAGKGLSPAAANGYVSILLYLFVAGAIIVPMISDRLGTRKWVFFISIAINALAVMATAFLTGPALAAAFTIWGFTTGGVILCFVVPLEHPSLGPSFAGAIIGFLMAVGFFGGFISPIVGNAIAEKVGGATAILLWGACYLIAAFVFLLVRETHPKRIKK